MGVSISESLRAGAVVHAARVALVSDEEGQITYGQLAALAQRLAPRESAARAAVALCTESRLAQAAVLAAGLMADCVVIPINPAATDEAKRRLVAHARPTVVLDDAAAEDLLGAVRAGSAADGLAPGARPGRGGLLVYTSGSTGTPKGVLLSDANIGANVAFAVRHFGYDADWVTGSVLPLFHTFTVISDLLPMLVCGGRVVVTPGFTVPRLKAVARAFADHGVRSFSGVPILFDTMLATRFRLPASVRFAIAGAAPLGEDTQARYLAAYGHAILPCYGLTETTCFAAASSPGHVRPRAVGRAAGIEVEVVDDDGVPVPAGTNGEIAMRGPSVIAGSYFLGEESTGDGAVVPARGAEAHAEAFRKPGWFLSGDIGQLDADGYLTITGRKKNMLIRGGEKVYLEDVDRCLEVCVGVAEACSVRIGAATGRTARHEDEAVAFVVVGPAGEPIPDRLALVEHVIRVLGPYSRLDDVVFVDQIPRSPSGKALREVLSARYLAGEYARGDASRPGDAGAGDGPDGVGA